MKQTKNPRVLPFLVTLLAVLMLFPLVSNAQEATLVGTVADATGGVLPGVTITATHEATGNTFVAVTDDKGAFRLLVRTGTHRVVAELPGFASVTRTVDFLVNQQVPLNIQMSPSTVQESVTVTGEAPLVETTSSEIGGNIDPNQMQNLPVNGRNWLDLAMLAPGSRQNASSETLGVGTFRVQINVDGQQLSNEFNGDFGQPRYSRDSMSEVQLITNRFDATQGRSSGIQMQAITKSGTNMPQGTFSGFFRSDRFNAADFIAKRVLPYSDQQLVWTYGGPIIKDKLHVFGSYEYERNPNTFTYQTPFPVWNQDQESTRTQKIGLARLDYQVSSRTRLSFRLNKSREFLPVDDRFSGGANRTPNSVIRTARMSTGALGTFTQVLSNNAVNEVRGGYAGVSFYDNPAIQWPQHPADIGREFGGSPILSLSGGFTVGQGYSNAPLYPVQKTDSVRDDLSFSYQAGGRHDVKSGGEYLHVPQKVSLCNFCTPTYDMLGGPLPANLPQLIPDLFNPATWNLAALSSITRSVQFAAAPSFSVYPLRKEGALWFQDDWAIARDLTLNLGVRYDVAYGNSQGALYPPFIQTPVKTDKNDLAPRLGFAYSVNNRTVIRGGYGLYYANQDENIALWTLFTTSNFKFTVFNDGRPDFAANVFNGPYPTYSQAIDTWNRGLATRSALLLLDPKMRTQYSHQASLGLQRQIGGTMSTSVDWVYTGTRAIGVTADVNLAFNPATGNPYPASDQTKRPYSNFSSVGMRQTGGVDRFNGLNLVWQKRMSGHWQASATYSFNWQKVYQHLLPPSGCAQQWTLSASGSFRCDVPFTLAPVFQDEWSWDGSQVKRLVTNWIWDAPLGVQVSGLYFYGDNGKATPQAGVDTLVVQSGLPYAGAAGRLRGDGTLIQRNSFDRPSVHRVDVRLQRGIKLAGRTQITGMLEVFNVFNHQNYNTFVLNERSPAFGQPQTDKNIAFQPRVMQLGFRLAF